MFRYISRVLGGLNGNDDVFLEVDDAKKPLTTVFSFSLYHMLKTSMMILSPNKNNIICHITTTCVWKLCFLFIID
jgi:hypothetical protein